MPIDITSASAATQAPTGTAHATPSTTAPSSSTSNTPAVPSTSHTPTISTSTSTSSTPRPRRITAEAKAKLRAYFISMNWPLNRKLPKGENYCNGELGNIVSKYGLNRNQVANQLRNFKDEKYGNTQIKLLLDADQLEEKMKEGLSMESAEFVTVTLGRIASGQDIAPTSDFDNFAQVKNDFPEVGQTYIQLLANNTQHAGCILLTNLVDYWIKSAAEKFPKSASGLPDAEVQFQRGKRDKLVEFIDRWDELKEPSGFGSGLSSQIFSALGCLLHNLLYMEWSHCAIDNERPPVSIPTECMVSKFAKPVIYYVAGWTLYSASKALKVKVGGRPKFFAFVKSQSIGKEEAKKKGLPTSVVEKRKRRSAKIFCSPPYYDFICFVETVYLANLNLKMMKAYADGDIVEKIKTTLLCNDVALEKFTKLFDNEHCDSLSKDEQQTIMKYMMERYANMRGTYFVKHLKGNCNGNLVDKLYASQATRTKVANAVVSAKAVAEAKEKQLWKDAGDNAFEYADIQEKEEARHDNVALYD